MPDHIAHAFGKPGLARCHGPDPHAVDVDEGPGLDQMAQNFGDEERIAVGLGRQSTRELDAGTLEWVPARRLQERAHARFVEAMQRDAFGARSPVEIGERAGEGMAPIDVGVAVRDEYEDVRIGIEVRDDVTEEVHAPGVGPVRVVEQCDNGLRFRDPLQDVDDRVEHEQSFGVGIRGGGRGSVRRATRELGHEPGELAAMARNVFDDDFVAGARYNAAQELRPRRVRGGDVFVAPAEHHERAFLMGLASELRSETRLPDSRFADEEHGRRAVDLCALPRVGETQPLVVARREGQLSGLAPQRRGQRGHRADCRGPRHFEHHDRFRQAFQLDLADEYERELGATAGETANEIVAADLATVGRVAQSRRGDDRRAVAIAAFPCDIAHADADPHLDAAVVACLAIGPVDRALDVVCGIHRVGSRSERGEDPVAQTLHDRPVVRGDRRAENLVVAPPDEIGLDIAEPRP